MGLNRAFLDLIETSVEKTLGPARGVRMLELGDQVIADDTVPEETGKEYFTKRGFEHVSVDLNGLHGAVVRDLTRPEEFRDWHGAWDVLTNAGTTEHVEPFESQYDCWNILHDCVRPGGVFVHILPDVTERDEKGVWIDHCRYYYSQAFFDRLARDCGYRILSSEIIIGLRCVALEKAEDRPFMSDRQALLDEIAIREPAPAARGPIRRLLRRFGL